MLGRLRRVARHYLGLNRRNRDLVARYNPRSSFQLVDDKLKTKELLRRHGLPVVKTLRVYRSHADVAGFEHHVRAWREFVIKPAQGAGGDGVLVVERSPDGQLLADLKTTSVPGLQRHLSDILAGLYSLDRRYDHALIECRVRASRALSGLSVRGVPDIRVIVFRGVPLMAMLRLATRASGGRANLHQGGIGVGVDLPSGVTTHAIMRRRSLRVHPDTGRSLDGVRIPYWDEILGLASACGDAVPLGYLGVDLALDGDSGPTIFELNARPGVHIQLANRRGLRLAVEAVERWKGEDSSVHERVRFGKALAGEADDFQ